MKSYGMKRETVKKYVCILLIGTLLLTGCGTSKQTVQNGTDQTKTEDAGETLSPDSQKNGDNGAIVEDKVTYTMACQLSPNWGNPENGEFWKQLEEETNVHIDWVTYLESESAEKFKLLMASGDYPDGFIGGLGGGDADVITYGTQGIYIPLNDLIDQYAANFNRKINEEYPDVKKMITAPDGNIYAMPSILYNPVIYNNTFINKTWLAAVGAEVPKTTEEFREVLNKFKTEDPNGNGTADEIPLSFIYSDWGASDAGGYFGAFGYPLSPDYVLIDRGKVLYLGAQDSLKDGADWLSTLYKENLIDKDIFTQDESAYTAKVSTGTVGVFSSWDLSAAGDYASDYEALMPLTGPAGENNGLKEGITGFYKSQFIITNKAKNPEVLMKWADRFYQDIETGLNATQGIGPDKNKSWYKDDSGNIIWNADMPAEYERGQQQLPFAPAILGEQAESILAASGLGKQKAEIVEQMLPYAKNFTDGTWERWPICFMTTDETEEISTLESDLMNYSKNQLAKWIAGERDVNSDWNDYLNELKKIGLDKWLELKQQVYDRYNSVD